MVLHEIYKEIFYGGKTFDPSRNHSITSSTLHNMCMIFFVGVAPHCIDSNTIEGIEESSFDGPNWEKFIETSDIRQRSKE